MMTMGMTCGVLLGVLNSTKNVGQYSVYGVLAGFFISFICIPSLRKQGSFGAAVGLVLSCILEVLSCKNHYIFSDNLEGLTSMGGAIIGFTLCMTSKEFQLRRVCSRTIFGAWFGILMGASFTKGFGPMLFVVGPVIGVLLTVMTDVFLARGFAYSMAFAGAAQLLIIFPSIASLFPAYFALCMALGLVAALMFIPTDVFFSNLFRSAQNQAKTSFLWICFKVGFDRKSFMTMEFTKEEAARLRDFFKREQVFSEAEKELKKVRAKVIKELRSKETNSVEEKD